MRQGQDKPKPELTVYTRNLAYTHTAARYIKSSTAKAETARQAADTTIPGRTNERNARLHKHKTKAIDPAFIAPSWGHKTSGVDDKLDWKINLLPTFHVLALKAEALHFNKRNPSLAGL